jgi:hypothetical protein
MQIIAHCVQKRHDVAPDIFQDTDTQLNYAVLAGQTEGYTARDLEDFVARAMHQAAMRMASNADTKVSVSVILLIRRYVFVDCSSYRFCYCFCLACTDNTYPGRF